MICNVDRRQLLVVAGTAALGLVAGAPRVRAEESQGKNAHDAREVLAVEDLMREHGVLRRALLVYAEAASRAAQGSDDLPMDALGRTAALFRTFGEDYHERALEERHVFVPLINAGGENGALARTLTAQHQRGREITDYIARMAKQGRLDPADRMSFSGTLTSFVRMYEHHAAIEDTIVFPAWKRTLSGNQYEELSDQFEDLEHRMFGKDGFEDALKRIAAIEQSFGLADLSALTAPAPPRAAK
ncbi:MAG TPA: hemerythrin domain-containing protein [Steroidobacteraceae bacterium]|nr:hemerythrin domain-containing protein [Steroidobacteraceae bacterium]